MTKIIACFVGVLVAEVGTIIGMAHAVVWATS